MAFFHHIVTGVLTHASVSGAQKGPIGRASDQFWNAVYTNELPSPQELLHAYRTGWISQAEATMSLKLHGIAFDPSTFGFSQAVTGWTDKCNVMWNRIYLSQRLQPPPVEILTLLNRGAITYEDAKDRYRKLGFDEPGIVDTLLSLKNELPGPSDLVRFAVRHVFEPDLVHRFGFSFEMPQAFLDWHAKQGFGYDLPPVDWRGNGPEPWTWAHAFWWSHWVWPSPSFGYTAVQRLRPTGGVNGGPRDPSGQVFTSDDLFYLLRGNDYPPYFRPMLQALSYHPIGIRQIKQLVQYDLAGKQDVNELFQDMGYRPDQADMLAEMSIRAERSRRFLKEITGVKGKLIDAYNVGTISRKLVAVQLYRLTLQDDMQLGEYDALPSAQQEALAAADAGVQLTLDGVDYDKEARLAKQAIASTKKSFVKGVLNAQDAHDRLLSYGIQPERADEYISLWSLELSIPHKEFTAQGILKLYAKLLISANEAAIRLYNLGWSLDDIPLMIAEADISILEAAQRAAKQRARDAKQAKRDAEAAVRAKIQEHKAARSELQRHGTPADLARWVKEGLITPEDMAARLAALDWPPDDAARRVADAVLAAQAKQPKTPKAPKTPKGSG